MKKDIVKIQVIHTAHVVALDLSSLIDLFIQTFYGSSLVNFLVAQSFNSIPISIYTDHDEVYTGSYMCFVAPHVVVQFEVAMKEYIILSMGTALICWRLLPITKVVWFERVYSNWKRLSTSAARANAADMEKNRNYFIYIITHGLQDRDLITSIDLQKKEAQQKSMKKQQREQRKAAIEKIRAERGKWMSSRSELISYAKMLSDYFTYINKQTKTEDEYEIYEKTTTLMEKFCFENNLQVKAVKEVHYLCLQLERLIFDATKNEGQEFKSLFTGVSITHPTEDQEKLLQQLIIIGLCESFARKSPIFDAHGNEIKQTSKMRAMYESQESKDKLSLHPFSPLYKEKPEYMAYQEIYALENPTTGKMKYYLKGVTKIDNLSWMFKLSSPVLISTSKPITEENNAQSHPLDLKLARSMAGKDKGLITYDSDKDQVMVYVRAFYGTLRWDLSIHQVTLGHAREAITDEDEYYGYVAYAFLEGMMFPKIKTHLKPYFLNSNCKSVLERGNMTGKVTKIVSLLRNSGCDTKQKIEDKWNSGNPYFLLDALFLWLKDDKSKQMAKAMWPPNK